MEKRMLDVAFRYGINQYSVPKWKAIFGIKQDFERIIGCSIYALLPGVVENTFESRGEAFPSEASARRDLSCDASSIVAADMPGMLRPYGSC
jgi:hypothetical protein